MNKGGELSLAPNLNSEISAFEISRPRDRAQRFDGIFRERHRKAGDSSPAAGINLV